MPVAVGIPEIVTVFDDQEPETPVGNPLKVAPVAPVVAYVILVIGLLLQVVCEFVPAAELKVIEFKLATTALRALSIGSDEVVTVAPVV